MSSGAKRKEASRSIVCRTMMLALAVIAAGMAFCVWITASAMYARAMYDMMVSAKAPATHGLIPSWYMYPSSVSVINGAASSRMALVRMKRGDFMWVV